MISIDSTYTKPTDVPKAKEVESQSTSGALTPKGTKVFIYNWATENIVTSSVTIVLCLIAMTLAIIGLFQDKFAPGKAQNTACIIGGPIIWVILLRDWLKVEIPKQSFQHFFNVSWNADRNLMVKAISNRLLKVYQDLEKYEGLVTYQRNSNRGFVKRRTRFALSRTRHKWNKGYKLASMQGITPYATFDGKVECQIRQVVNLNDYRRSA